MLKPDVNDICATCGKKAGRHRGLALWCPGDIGVFEPVNSSAVAAPVPANIPEMSKLEWAMMGVAVILAVVAIWLYVTKLA